jgi:hypothetical protein
MFSRLECDDYAVRSSEANEIPAVGGSNVLVIEDTALADGSFLLWHYLSLFLKQSSTTRVCYVSLKHSFAHLCAVGRKLGVHVNACRASGQLIFVDLLSGSFEDGSELPTLAQLYQKINNAVQDSQGPVYIIVDDVLALAYLNDPMSSPGDQNYVACLQFVQACKRLVSTHDDCSAIMLVHADVAGMSSPGCTNNPSNTSAPIERVVGMSIRHEATHILHVRSLPSGFSHDVQGEISAWSLSAHGCIVMHTWQFRATDSTVRIFECGQAGLALIS